MSRTRKIFETEGEPSGEPDRYHGLVEIGRGGMAVVYRAWDSHMDREVALKVAREEVAGDPDVRRRFEEESRVAGTFSHPNLLPVFDRGSYRGRPYLAMQLVDGVPLDRSNLPFREALACLATAAEALDHAHARGVIHRDLKPSNILLARDGRVFLTDFGVARQTQAPPGGTATGTVVGTPAYMSPEQARGEAVDARSDIYSLGATLYELATGRPPYEGADPQALLEAVRTRPPPAPRKANPAVSRNVESIIRMAMERLPRDRYPTAQAMAEDLRYYQNRRRPLARARGWRYYVGRELVRHPIRTSARILTALIVAGGLTLGGLVGSAWLDYRRALAEPDLASKLALLEDAAVYCPPARRELKKLHAEIAAAARVRLERVRVLERSVREALDREDFETADRLLAELKGLDGGSGDNLHHLVERRKADVKSRERVARIRLLLDAGDLDAAARELKELPPAHSERDRLHAKLREERFARRAGELKEAAARADLGRFEPVFAELASSAHDAQRNRDDDLGSAARALGLALAEKGDRAGTLRWLSEAERRGLADADLYRIRGLTLLAERRWDAAEGDLERFRRRSPPDTPTPSAYWELFHQRAREAVAAGLWNQAQTHLHAALVLSKDQAILWHDLGLVRWKTVVDPELSLGDLDKALRDPALKPSTDYVPIVLGYVDSRGAKAFGLDAPSERDLLWAGLLGRLDQVTGRLDAKPETLRVVRAGLLRKLMRVDEALAELGPAGDSARVRLARARAHVAAASRPGAPGEDLQRGYEQLAGDEPAILAWRGLLGARLGRAQAVADLQRGELFPAARFEHARLLLGSGAHGSASKEVDLALAGADRLGEDDLLWLGAETLATPPSVARNEFRRACLLLRAQVRFSAGDMGGCVEDATLLLDEAPAPEARLFRGLARLQLPKPEWKGAAEDLEAYLLARPDDARARLALARACLSLDRARDAEAQCDLVLVKKGTPEAFYLRGLARKALRNANGARSDFEEAQRLCPPKSPLLPLILRESMPR